MKIVPTEISTIKIAKSAYDVKSKARFLYRVVRIYNEAANIVTPDKVINARACNPRSALLSSYSRN